jgi:hypothetical protein
MRHWIPITICVGGLAFLVVGAVLEYWFLLPVGIYFLFRWFRIAHTSVLNVRNSRVAKGVIGVLKPHPLLHAYATATAMTQDGRRIPIAVEKELVRDIMSDAERVEIMFLDDPRSQFSLAIAARRAPPDDRPVVLRPG